MEETCVWIWKKTDVLGDDEVGGDMCVSDFCSHLKLHVLSKFTHITQIWHYEILENVLLH